MAIDSRDFFGQFSAGSGIGIFEHMLDGYIMRWLECKKCLTDDFRFAYKIPSKFDEESVRALIQSYGRRAWHVKLVSGELILEVPDDVKDLIRKRYGAASEEDLLDRIVQSL